MKVKQRKDKREPSHFESFWDVMVEGNNFAAWMGKTAVLIEIQFLKSLLLPHPEENRENGEILN